MSTNKPLTLPSKLLEIDQTYLDIVVADDMTGKPCHPLLTTWIKDGHISHSQISYKTLIETVARDDH